MGIWAECCSGQPKSTTGPARWNEKSHIWLSTSGRSLPPACAAIGHTPSRDVGIGCWNIGGHLVPQARVTSRHHNALTSCSSWRFLSASGPLVLASSRDRKLLVKTHMKGPPRTIVGAAISRKPRLACLGCALVVSLWTRHISGPGWLSRQACLRMLQGSVVVVRGDRL